MFISTVVVSLYLRREHDIKGGRQHGQMGRIAVCGGNDRASKPFDGYIIKSWRGTVRKNFRA